MKLNNKKTDKNIILIKNNFENIKKAKPTLTIEQLNNKVNEVAIKIFLDETEFF